MRTGEGAAKRAPRKRRDRKAPWITPAIERGFAPALRNLGERLAEAGAVTIEKSSRDRLRALVHDGGIRQVAIERHPVGLMVRCTCPTARAHGADCAHMWAAMRAADGGSAERTPPWLSRLAAIESQLVPGPRHERWPPEREIVYLLRPDSSRREILGIEVAWRQRKQNGDWSKPVRADIGDVGALPDAGDRRLVALLDGGDRWRAHGERAVSRELALELVPRLCASGRCLIQRLTGAAAGLPAAVWEGDPWVFRIEAREDGENALRLEGVFRRGEERLPADSPDAATRAGLLVRGDRVAPYVNRGADGWVDALAGGPLVVPRPDGPKALRALLGLGDPPDLDLPAELAPAEIAPPAKPLLLMKKPARYGDRLPAELAFDYDGLRVPREEPRRVVFQTDPPRLVLRSEADEGAAEARLAELGFRRVAERGWPGPSHRLELSPRHLPRVVPQLVAAGWHVEAEGQLYRRASRFRFGVTSGVDWFELRAEASFGPASVSLPAILQAIARGRNIVELGDGTFGVLPEEWLEKYGIFAEAGEVHGDVVRFRPAQAALLDALLAAQPHASADEAFERMRQELRAFRHMVPAEAPPGFEGALRDYQKEGLGWLGFLQRLRLGGCLADDMGLGKTVQVLALLASRAAPRDGRAPGARPPSIVVVPRSLLFNWRQEAERFTPRLRVLEHRGPDRAREAAALAGCDVVLTTYGTLRRDAAFLAEAEFDYVVLDEAQAIKNAETDSAKAVRLLRGRHRLALSGTPVENHLGELWSLFEFLNPGMLGASALLRRLGADNEAAGDARALLARALRPFILRRTKQQVARDLPPRSEQTIGCPLGTAQRRTYDELREHYRERVLRSVRRQGLGRSAFLILEALLRLRQAACHPALIDPSRSGQPSAKLDALLPMLHEVREEGHKALVFSQFTRMLGLVRSRLDEAGVPYEYLDGQTLDRQARVERFQSDPGCPLFLVSLKAGGLGLNLTAAEYVFLLDPWWNPAVEMQAIDRAHRIGQTRPVFAYRLVAPDTVEERILELQKAKRDLAAAIITEDNSLIRSLGPDDLRLLLS